MKTDNKLHTYINQEKESIFNTINILNTAIIEAESAPAMAYLNRLIEREYIKLHQLQQILLIMKEEG